MKSIHLFASVCIDMVIGVCTCICVILSFPFIFVAYIFCYGRVYWEMDREVKGVNLGTTVNISVLVCVVATASIGMTIPIKAFAGRLNQSGMLWMMNG